MLIRSETLFKWMMYALASLLCCMDETKPGAVLLGEVWEDGSNKIAYSLRRRYLLGDETHGLMNYPFRTAALNWLKGGDADAFREAMLMGQAKKDPSKLAEAEAVKKQVTDEAARLAVLEQQESELDGEIRKRMMVIPQIIDETVPIGKDDSENVEVQRFGKPKTPAFEIPYHTEIMERFNGIDMDAAGRVSGSGFYYLLGDIARLHVYIFIGIMY